MTGMRPLLALFAALPLAFAAEAPVSSLFPPETRAVIGIRLQALSQAGLFHGIDAESRKSATGMFDKSPLAGFDPLKDLDEVLIATTGSGENPPSIVILRGRFPLDKISPDTPRYHDIAIMESPQ